MRTFAEILKRHGFKESDLTSMGHSGQLLRQTIVHYGEQLTLEESVSEDKWMDSMDKARWEVEGWGRGSIVDPEVSYVPLSDLDPHIRGIVRWLNELGFVSIFSCDGHDRKSAFVDLKYKPSKRQLELLKSISRDGVKISFMKTNHNRLFFRYPIEQQNLLLEQAEHLHDATVDEKLMKEFEIESMRTEIMKWLAYPGESGNEAQIRDLLHKELKKYVDFVDVDSAGNLLGESKIVDGPTLLLSAHMDIYSEIDTNREILQDGTILSSSTGILGADDRAGIAAILQVLKRLSTTSFKGRIKVAFTVEEEIGCVGSSQIRSSFFKEIDAAIVFDRRGNRDIVTSCGNYISFCSESFGQLFEKAGKLANMPDWKAVAGGSSDTRVFAEHGIESVNLSVGFRNEHTERETVDYVSTYETVKLVESLLKHGLLINYLEIEKTKQKEAMRFR